MSTSTVYTETVLSELAYLITLGRGDSAVLNAPAGLASFFESADVVASGRKLYVQRQEALADPVERQTLTDYFETVGTVIAASDASFSATGTSTVGATTLYFVVPHCTVELVIAGGRAAFALHTDPPTLLDLLARHVDDEPEVAVIGRFRADQDDRYLAISHDTVAYSDDGHRWQAGDPGEQRAPGELLRAFASIG